VSFEYSVTVDGSQLVYSFLPGLQKIASVCTRNGTWYPNPANITCTTEGIVYTKLSIFPTEYYNNYIILCNCYLYRKRP
jgi:hypothetical protein